MIPLLLHVYITGVIRVYNVDITCIVFPDNYKFDQNFNDDNFNPCAPGVGLYNTHCDGIIHLRKFYQRTHLNVSSLELMCEL